MSKVGSMETDNYRYYRDRISDQRNEHDEEVQKLKQRERERLRSLSERNEENLRRVSEKNAEAIQNVKERASDALSSQKEAARLEVANARNAVYDRLGRGPDAVSEADERIKRVERSFAEEAAANERALMKTRESYDRKSEDRAVQQAKDIEQAVDRARESALRTYEEQSRRSRGDYSDDKKAIEDKYAALSRRVVEDSDARMSEANRALDVSKKDQDYRYRKLQDSVEQRHSRNVADIEAKASENIEAQRRGHGKEVEKLRSENNSLLQITKDDYRRGFNQGRSDAVKEYEQEFNFRERAAQEAYERQLNKTKEDVARSESYLKSNADSVLKEKELHFAKLIGKQNQESLDQRKDLEATFTTDRDRLIQQMKRDQEYSRGAIQRNQERANQDRSNALLDQAKANQEATNLQRKNYGDQIAYLQKALHEKSTTEDVTAVSPAAEARLRDIMMEEYGKTMNAHIRRDNNRSESVRREYEGRLSDTIQFSRDRETKALQRSTLDRQLERTELLKHVQDTEVLKEAELTRRTQMHERDKSSSEKNFIDMINGQRRQYELLLHDLKMSSEGKMQELRQEMSFREQMAAREGAAEQNRLTRDFQKKLNDQKDEYEATLMDMKAKTELHTREVDRRSRDMLQQQQKEFEHRIAQLEFQSKQREQTIIESYTDEIDKLKRSHARLVQKKG